LLFASCGTDRKKSVTPAVYYWKSVFSLSPAEQNWLKETGVKKIYLRFFDVDWDKPAGIPLPVGDVQISENNAGGIEIIPVVYITNKTLINTTDTLITELALNISKKIADKASRLKTAEIKEVQIDCDWTDKTRDKYFNLLKEIKKENSGKTLSATIRLHQVKYFERTGAPPADRGMLMFYNIGRPEDIHTVNSIFDLNTAKLYMYNFDKYPLPLDVVLPAFGWGVVFRNKHFIYLINELDYNTVSSSSSFGKISNNQFVCLKDVIIFGRLIKKEDIVRIESAGFNSTMQAARLASENIRTKNITTAIFHLNEELIKKYEKKEFNEIIDCFN
jgi:hypothetical protein